MSNRLVTIATFHDTVEAAVVKNFLEAQGIHAELADEDTVATNWSLAGAIGGIKLQVPPIHVERAEMLIDKVRSEQRAVLDEPPLPHTGIAAQEIAEDLQAEQEDKLPINKLTDQLFRCAVFGLILWPLQLYALYLMACVFGAEGRVSPNRRWKIWVSILLNVPMMAAIGIPALWAFGFLSADPAGPGNPRWRRYDVPERGFSVRFPHEPFVHSDLGKNRYGQMTLTIWSTSAFKRSYWVQIEHCAETMAKIPQEEVIEKMIEDIQAQEPTKLIKQAPAQTKDDSGQEIWIERRNSTFRMRIFARQREFFFVMAGGSREDVDSEEAEAFFKSFRFR
ncbi:MAG: hypothetical protein HYX68_21420 [Planctomycetes bacterium]|nr:hypothetical protein [Planctomycetota bacterium]